MRHGRLPWFEPSELNEEQRAFYDALLSGPRGTGPHPRPLTDDKGRLQGANNARLLEPKLGTAIQELGAVIRYKTNLPERMREIAILEVASFERCSFEWHGHEDVARRAGMVDEELLAIREHQPCALFSEQENDARAVVQKLLKNRDLSDAEFIEAEGTLGLETLFDLVTIVGYYQHTALSMRLWRVPLRDGTSPVFEERS